MSLFVDDTDFRLYVGDVRECLRELEPESVHCVVTSPPYWGLRDYGTGAWDGGDPDCDHEAVLDAAATAIVGTDGFSATNNAGRAAARVRAGRNGCKCGATRVDQQLGLEATPDLFVAAMVDVFREVRRVLRRDGTCWLNLGDSYASDPNKGGSGTPNGRNGRGEGYGRGLRAAQPSDGDSGHTEAGASDPLSALAPGAALKPKDLCGIPWRVAFALQADGWYLRSDIVWSKPNPMPESVTDRPTKAHEYVFLLTRSPRYFYDADAIREPHTAANVQKQRTQPSERGDARTMKFAVTERYLHPAGRNARSVWEIATQPYPEAHFATFPEALPERCIKAGCPVGGTVLDPFMGSGTTALVARKLGRRSIGIELNPEYAALCARRLQELSLLA